MHLSQLEISGFKSFAERATVDFLPPSERSRGITAVVGPNGSGKSNVADAIRWVLGEQSLKLLRGKKAEDVIFSGSGKRPRSGFAEATLHLNNEDGRIPIDASEVSISRRIFQGGDSEYLINKSAVRLADVQLLLAQAQFGARSYSVIGQGMVDQVLMATPQERKEFFDEAAGVRQFQLKRNQSVGKLKATKENLEQAGMLLMEIEPRLRSLSRQVKRLEERGALEQELHGLKHRYYGALWHELASQISAREKTLSAIEKDWRSREATLDEAKRSMSALEEDEVRSEGFDALQKKYDALLEERQKLAAKQLMLRSKIEVAEQVRKKTFSAMPLSRIIEEVAEISRRQESLAKKLASAKTLGAAQEIGRELKTLSADTSTLVERLERPVSESEPARDAGLEKELADLSRAVADADTALRGAHSGLQDFGRNEQKKREKFFSLQRGLQDKITAALTLERRLNDERVEQARLETRRQSLEREMTTELAEKAERVKEAPLADALSGRPETVLPEIQKLKYQLDLIGGIDPDVVREYEETRQRHEFLSTQTTDLTRAVSDIERVIAELDLTIKARSESAFRTLNRDFDRYFKMLFEGGDAKLVQIMKEEGAEDAETESTNETAEERTERIAGIEIVAQPPGKRIKNIAMLSGGERALVSIALICAIMDTNPSPFVVLDEVDASLDEANAGKFSAILEELAHKTQFIVITHNRYTMQKANVLYGVTMRDDGTSQMLSINLDEAEDVRTKRTKAAAN